MQFFILMIDYGRDTSKSAHGFGADVQPEFTRQNIVDQVRKVLKEGRNTIAFVKYVDGNWIEDQTKEIIEDAKLANALGSDDGCAAAVAAADRIAFNRDRARDYSKETA